MLDRASEAIVRMSRRIKATFPGAERLTNPLSWLHTPVSALSYCLGLLANTAHSTSQNISLSSARTDFFDQIASMYYSQFSISKIKASQPRDHKLTRTCRDDSTPYHVPYRPLPIASAQMRGMTRGVVPRRDLHGQKLVRPLCSARGIFGRLPTCA